VVVSTILTLPSNDVISPSIDVISPSVLFTLVFKPLTSVVNLSKPSILSPTIVFKVLTCDIKPVVPDPPFT
jgi:hypothetical protein